MHVEERLRQERNELPFTIHGRILQKNAPIKTYEARLVPGRGECKRACNNGQTCVQINLYAAIVRKRCLN